MGGRNLPAMNPIEHAIRLHDTNGAFLGVWLAAAAVVVTAVLVVRRARERGFRLIPVAALVVSAGLLVGVVGVESAYYSWYRHRCVLHGSDIDECSDKDAGWLGWIGADRG